MAKSPKDLDFHEYASPACYLHELDPAYAPEPDAQQRRDVARWRKAERERLIAARLAIPAGARAAGTERIAAALEAALGDLSGRIISLYWPFRGEPDFRPWMKRLAARGVRTALPVVAERAKPLIFKLWSPGDPLTPGIWNIPVPANGAEVVPHIVLAPVVGFDPAGYRLGYGGGYFDRTLAALAPRPTAIGVGWSAAAIPTIFPQPHDIPMDLILTDLTDPASAPSGPAPARA
ncbi:5-formyltetrahydrofolate cyclo-ligase [Roseococcus sp. YIM B11640]|uniref:5-formyltetrahydrofolate cyclo-ligase n=1 Tax=Roseococcus sp. YIM B11640 TaxID=3133973 RepID=UPI003C7DB730